MDNLTQTYPSWSVVGSFIVYIMSMLFIGVGASYLTKNLDDYILGGRNVSPFVSALSAGASDMSGWLMMALPGAIYVSGLSQAWIIVGLLIGAYSNWTLVAKRLRVYTEKLDDALTIPAYLKNRFEDKTNVLTRVSSLMVLFFFTVYTAAGFHACAVLFQTMFHLAYFPSLVIGFFSIVSYVLIGGFIGVCWTDTVQGVLIFTALIFLPTATLAVLHYEHYAILELTQSVRSAGFFNPFHAQSFVGVVSMLGWGLGYFGQPHILVRFMAIRRPSDIKLARRICMSWMALSLLGAAGVGFLSVAYFAKAPLENPESSFIMLSQALFPDLIAGVLLAAVLSAIMSSSASQLIILSSVVAEDFYRPLRQKASGRELLWAGRMSVTALAGVSFVLAARNSSTLLSIVAYAWAGLGATFGPVILFSLFWPRMTRSSAIAAIIVGGLVVIFWEKMGHIGGIFHLYSIIPGFVCASGTILGVSWLDQKSVSSSMHRTFEAVQVSSQHIK